MNTRRKVVAALVVAFVLGAGAPSGAATGSVDDPEGDVDDPQLDILGLDFTNDADRLTATVEVAETVPFSDDRWADGELGVGVVTSDPTMGDENFDVWMTFVVDGVAQGYTLRGCFVDVSRTATAYVFTLEGPCARGEPRSLEYGAITVDGVGLGDATPDTEDLAPAVAAAAMGRATRLAGTDRILTAIALSQDIHDTAGAMAAVVAASDNFPDALAGGPLASYAGGPLLLTGKTGLDARVKAELERVLAPGSPVYVLGGTAALSDQVVTDIDAAGFDARRVAGLNRFETAVAIAGEVDELIGGHLLVLVADGRAFTDALIAAAVAPGNGAVIVLTDGSAMPDATAAFLQGDDADQLAIGSNAAAAAPGTSITGGSPSELSVNVANELFPIGGALAVASETTFADALAGGPHIASVGAPLLLTDPTTLSSATAGAIEDADGSLREVIVYGGTAAVSEGVVAAIETALQP